ncbi:hypothetical protein BD779DRAFT_510931 [Infundibulicybe gibba]|nr:hypothetical protein BD779DRAFT_510931 [Infundibulicybe gibba]
MEMAPCTRFSYGTVNCPCCISARLTGQHPSLAPPGCSTDGNVTLRTSIMIHHEGCECCAVFYIECEQYQDRYLSECECTASSAVSEWRAIPPMHGGMDLAGELVLVNHECVTMSKPNLMLVSGSLCSDLHVVAHSRGRSGLCHHSSCGLHEGLTHHAPPSEGIRKGEEQDSKLPDSRLSTHPPERPDQRLMQMRLN